MIQVNNLPGASGSKAQMVASRDAVMATVPESPLSKYLFHSSGLSSEVGYSSKHSCGKITLAAVYGLRTPNTAFQFRHV